MALTNDQITAQNFKDFYGQIRPYLNGQVPTFANQFSRSDLYSTSEKIIGCWTDGKPIYQKTIVDKTPVVTTDGTLATKRITISSNLGKVISYNIYHEWGSGNSGGLLNDCYTITGGEARYIRAFIDYSQNAIALATDRDAFSNQDVYITIQYTKTTDSAIKVGTGTDYSTEEQVVGTWIDGKPLYQKTYVATSPSNNTDTKIIDLPESFNVKKVDGFLLQAPNNVMPINSYYNSSSYVSTYAQYYPESGVRMMAANGQYQNKTCYITILYTKTTD